MMGLNVDNEQFYIENGILYLVKSVDNTKLVIPEGVEAIDKNWLPLIKDFNFFDELVLSSSIKVIPMGFFRNRTIKKIYLSNGLKEIRAFSFLDCTKLEEIEIPSSVEVVGVRSFYGCSNLNKVILYDTLKKIDSKAFVKEEIRNDDILQSVILPENIVLRYSSYLGLEALADKFLLSNVCRSVDSRFLNINVILEGPRLSEKEELEIRKKFISFGIVNVSKKEVIKDDFSEIILSGGLEKVPKMAFMWNKFRKCVMSDGLKVIEDYSFSDCKNLEEIEIPSSVEEIGQVIFSNCTNLEKLTIYDTLERIGSGAFVIDECMVDGHYYTIKLPSTIILRYSSFNGLCCLIDKLIDSGHFNFWGGRVPEFKIVLEGPKLTEAEDIWIMSILTNWNIPNIEKNYYKSPLCKVKERKVGKCINNK